MRTHNKLISSLLKSLLLIGAFFVATATLAQGFSPDEAEVLRRGNSVEHIAGSQADAETVSLAALAPPADDSHKWFITLVKQPKCKPCERLLADFSTDANLRAFADLNDAKNSWAHFNIYSIDDESQAWRFENIKLQGFPTLLVQPPRNWRYGNPSKVVLQKTGYDGNAKKLAEQIRAAIRTEAAKSEGKNKDTQTVRREDAEKNAEGRINANDQCPSTNDQRLGQKDEGGRLKKSDLQPLSLSLQPFASPTAPPFAPPKNGNPLTVPADIDPDAKPNVLPISPEKTPAPAIDPLKPDAPNITPNIDPSKTNAPSTVDPNKLTPALYPQHPEAVVIVDKFADTVAKDASWAKIRSAVQRMQRDRPGLIVRVLDRRDAANYPVQPNELPAIITTSEGRIETKLDKTLLETVTNDAPAFPWQALLSLFTGGFSWVGVGALGIWAIAVIRRWRIAQGKKILVDNESAGRIRELLEKLFERLKNQETK